MEEIRKVSIAQPFIGEEEANLCREVLNSGWLTQGPKVKDFENHFGQFHQSKFALSTTSCTTSLHLGLLALGVGPGDEVLVPAFSWIATANAVLYCGAKPVFVDVDPQTYNIDPSRLKKLRTKKTKAIIPVHLFGLCADIDAIIDLLPEVKILEDAACAVGASYKGKFAGTLGDMGAFSFHPRKIITTGEGGMLTTQNQKYYEIACKLRNHGAEVSEEERHSGPHPYLLPDFNFLGFNYRMTDIQGAIGICQLQRLSTLLSDRQKWAQYYLEHFQNISWLRLPKLPKDGTHSWQSFVCYIDESKCSISRNKIMERLDKKGISVRPGTHAIILQNYYRNNFNLNRQDFPGAIACQNYTIALPLHNRMNKEDFDYVIKNIREIS